MSVQKLRELKLYKKLQKDLTYRQKLQDKIKLISNCQTPKDGPQGSRKLNNNKKYFLEQQKNAQIQRQNRILYDKIQSQGSKNHYYNNKSRFKNHSSKTLNSIQDSQDHRNQRKYNNLSENKIHYNQQQSRISFQQSQQLMRHKKPKKKRIITQLSPQIIDLLKSRMVEKQSVENQQNTLFQGIAEIDSVRFKVKIVIKTKIYLLTGRNKHTDIMLKMELNQYKKFHKQVLKGNPSNIFQYLVIDKGQIRFRTLQEEKQTQYLKKQKIYQIQEQQDEDNEEIQRKYKPYQKSKNQANKKFFNKAEQIHPQQKYSKIPYNEERLERDIIEHLNPSRTTKTAKSIQKMARKQNNVSIMNKIRNNPENMERNGKFHKYRTMEDYINDRDGNQELSGKDTESAGSTEVQIKHMKNRYKLPYI